MLQGVHWANFNENCEKWFGIAAPGHTADEGLVETIAASARILQNAGDFASSPIPDDDPYRLINSRFLEEMFTPDEAGICLESIVPATCQELASGSNQKSGRHLLSRL